jgi:hypothetical protein
VRNVRVQFGAWFASRLLNHGQIVEDFHSSVGPQTTEVRRYVWHDCPRHITYRVLVQIEL